MGYYANGDWSLKFRDADAVHAAADEIDQIRLDNGATAPAEVHVTVSSSLQFIANSVGATTSENADPLDFDAESLEVFGLSYGKIGHWTDNILHLLSKYATGTVDWRGEDGCLWRDRLLGDGTYKGFPGEISYPGDGDSELVEA